MSGPVETFGVRRRAAFYLPGYDPRRPAVYHAHLTSELAKAAALRGFSAQAGALEEGNGPLPGFDVAAEGEGWEARTRVTLLRWDDVARPVFREKLLARLPRLLGVGLDLARRGVLARVARLDKQFAAFVAYPYVATLALLALVLAAGLGAGALAASLAGSVLAGLAAGLAAAALAGWLALRLERPLYLRYLLEDWLFSFAHERGKTDLLADRLDVFAEALVAAARDPEIDEILLVGHSSGAFLAPETLARALARDPDLGRRGPVVSLLTIGTVAPLMLADTQAFRYREALARLADEPGIVWHEVQSRHDAMNACPVDPAAVSGLFAARPRWPKLMRLAMPQLARPGQLGFFRERLFFFRIHFRFIAANERPHWYDFYGALTGPLGLSRRHADVQDMRDA